MTKKMGRPPKYFKPKVLSFSADQALTKEIMDCVPPGDTITATLQKLVQVGIKAIKEIRGIS